MTTDVDFEQFIQLLDAALASDDKNVRQALRKFLFVTAMVLGDDCEPGPFTKMMDTMDAMQKRLADLEAQPTQTTTTDWYGGSSSPTFPGPTWTGGSITGSGTNIPWTNTNATSTTITPSTSTSTTGNITISGGTSGYCYMPSTSSGATSTITFTVPPEETGTEIKQEIEDALDRLANVV